MTALEAPLSQACGDGQAAASLAAAAQAAVDRSGEDTLILEVGPVLAITDAFLVTTGRNARHVRTIVEAVEAAAKAVSGRGPARVEGLQQAAWVLMDYGDFVVHVFDAETRAFYNLERLWSDVGRVDVSPTGPAAPAGPAEFATTAGAAAAAGAPRPAGPAGVAAPVGAAMPGTATAPVEEDGPLERSRG